jgi:hypothetical protein
MEDMRELLEEMRETFKSGHHKQVLARMDDEVSFGKVSPILRAVFQSCWAGRRLSTARKPNVCVRRVRSTKRWHSFTSFSPICWSEVLRKAPGRPTGRCIQVHRHGCVPGADYPKAVWR